MTKYIAHRGFAWRKLENTIEAFEYAASSRAFGIETDVHITADKKFVCFHDHDTKRLCGEQHMVKDMDYETLSALKIKKKHKIPTLEEFITICKKGNKHAVIELKSPFSESDLDLLVDEVKRLGYLDNSTFISFTMHHCLYLRQKLPNQSIQYLTEEFDTDILEKIAEQKIDLDIKYKCLSKGRIDYCKSIGLKVNCWTLNHITVAKYFESCGVDYITSNHLGH